RNTPPGCPATKTASLAKASRGDPQAASDLEFSRWVQARELGRRFSLCLGLLQRIVRLEVRANLHKPWIDFILGHAPNPRSQCRQLLLEPFVAALDMVNASNLTLALGCHR